MNAKVKRTLGDGRYAPDANEEYLLYQTIAGVWPWRDDEPGCRESVLKRLQEYAAKALSEAKVNLSWINPDPEYVAAVQGFLADIIMPDKRRRETPFMQTFSQAAAADQIFRWCEFGGAACVEGYLPRGAGLLPGHGVVGPEPGRSG